MDVSRDLGMRLIGEEMLVACRRSLRCSGWNDAGEELGSYNLLPMTYCAERRPPSTDKARRCWKYRAYQPRSEAEEAGGNVPTSCVD